MHPLSYHSFQNQLVIEEAQLYVLYGIRDCACWEWHCGMLSLNNPPLHDGASATPTRDLEL